MSDPYQKSMMENLYWWGIPTMFRCPNEGPSDAACPRVEQGQEIMVRSSLLDILYPMCSGNMYPTTYHWSDSKYFKI